MLLKGYKVFVKHYNGCEGTKKFQCNSKYDLFAYIGFLYSTSMWKIERIDYMRAVLESNEWDLMARDLKKVYESED